MRWVLLTMLAACRAGFDELPPETPDRTTPDSDLVIDTGLAVWYELDEITGKLALDTSGNEHHGACRATCPTVVDGYVERAAVFSGTVFLDVPPLAPMEEFTIAGFVKLPASSAAVACVAIDRAAGAVWRVCAASSGVTFRTGSHTLSIGMPITTGAWVHIAARWDGLDKALFVDGKRVGTAEALDTAAPTLVSIGGFNGQLDDVRIFERALDDAQVASLHRELE